nr:GGDEF and EAL domain-containing protein [Stakelama sediminis]
MLGLYDPKDQAGWSAIRAAQLNDAGQRALFMFAANVIGASIIVMIFAPLLPLQHLFAWAALVAAVSAAVTFHRLAIRRHTRTDATIRRVRDTWLEGAGLAAVWSVAPLAFGQVADIHAALALWIVLSVLMTAYAYAMASLPLATIIFLIVTGGSFSTTLLINGSPTLAATTILFTLLLSIICYGRGKALVLIRASELSLSERNETVSMLLREFEDANADWLWETDAQRRILRASPRFANSIGVDPTAINGKPFLEILAGSAWESGNFPQGLRVFSDHLKRRESFRELLLPVYVDGEERWWEMTASPRFDEQGSFTGFRGVGSDVTEARASADKINRMARYDALTGLPNRMLINETLRRAVMEADRWNRRCAFMMIDLDRFKAVNDTLGHPVGDRLLSRVSKRLKELMSDNEMIGRLGGDEFAVVIRDASDTEAVEALARQIIETLSRPYEVDQHTLYIGASVGIAIGPRDGRTGETLVRSADLALYRSKDQGGGVFHAYAPDLHVVAEERRVLEIALREALDKDQLHLTYQPVVNTIDGALTGFEALLRWTHPEYGAISPAKFVPMAEEARLIAPIGEWVLRNACHEAARWDGSVRVAVNVSAEQLHSPNFVTMVTQTLAQSGLAPERLELEVTESVFMREGTGAVQVLDKLLNLGVRLSLDDFGTGYSSLGYLSRTRFSSIKVDRSFVQSASRNVPEAVAIIRAVVALADSLGMTTTAEGVETEDEYQMVQHLGCSRIQGYYFGRPLPVEEARALIAGHMTNKSAVA